MYGDWSTLQEEVSYADPRITLEKIELSLQSVLYVMFFFMCSLAYYADRKADPASLCEAIYLMLYFGDL